MRLIINKTSFLFFLLLLAAFTLLGQTEGGPYDVNAPSTKVPPSWLDGPVLWIGLVAAILVVLLIFLRRGQSPTNSKLHKY
ncbi:hypothetical protein QWY85_13100 [Neolewinella lacunae]|uniref:Uncharacterized protein n=1 Tax=Neolewinella lacunae TaxID=1517758 RepID=A0A923PK72_9BACT|nr:hypothetical protein [Neolewinella lacunae]MBC6995565.1 hypothetical protein [Neolewinella lacunae]MDN3635601.1 hypothetical protein [Neolewinella lacunae]